MSEQQTVLPLDCPPVSSTVPAGLSVPSNSLTRNPSWAMEALKWVFSFPAMVGMLLAGLTFWQARTLSIDPDVWWHLRVGQDILRTHNFPIADSYSFTAANAPWIAYEWLGEVALAAVAKFGGVAALGILRIVMVTLVVTALYCLGALRSGNAKAASIPVVLLSPIVLFSFNLRPQMFGYLFLVLLLILLELFRKGRTWVLWTLPLLFAVWVNTHGSFIVGIGVLALYLCCGLKRFQAGTVEAVAWTAQQRVRLEMALLLSLAVLPATPYGTQLAAYPFDMMFNQPVNLASILEWRPMPFDQAWGKYFLAIVIFLAVIQVLFRFLWRVEELALAVGGTVMACLHVRMILLFVPFVVPVFAVVVARWIPRYNRAKDQFALNAVIMAAVALAVIWNKPLPGAFQATTRSAFPVDAVAYLDSHDVPGPLFNNYGFGGYLLNHGRKTFIDGRGDLFERSGVLSDYMALVQVKPAAFAILDRYKVRSCLLLRDEPLVTVLSSLPDWKRVYSDGTATLFVRAVDAGQSR